MAVEFFAEAGFPYPSRRNPSDDFLQCINSDFDTLTATLKGSQRLRDKPTTSDPFLHLATAQIKAALVEQYRRSKLLPDLPKIFRRYPISYISFSSWALQGANKNDFIGLEFDPLLPGARKLTGEEIIRKYFGVPIDRSKWWDFSIVVLIVVCYRLLFFTILKIRERASLLFQEIYAKRTLQHLDKRPSFRKIPYFASKRHQPLQSLSSHEGLNSPVH
ncbi:hypothetical protein CRYUN_Cryun25bG0058000 [Craigia yunnanensis]